MVGVAFICCTFVAKIKYHKDLLCDFLAPCIGNETSWLESNESHIMT